MDSKPANPRSKSLVEPKLSNSQLQTGAEVKRSFLFTSFHQSMVTKLPNHWCASSCATTYVTLFLYFWSDCALSKSRAVVLSNELRECLNESSNFACYRIRLVDRRAGGRMYRNSGTTQKGSSNSTNL